MAAPNVGAVRPALRLSKIVLSAAPWLIIAILLWAGLFIKPQPVGQTVQPPPIERSDAFYGIAVPTPKTLWLAGNAGKVVRSDDAGATWVLQGTPLKSHLQDIAAWDDKRAVAVGNGGAVIVTADGGATWREVSAPRSTVSNKLLRVKAMANGRAWAVGEMSAVLESEDYGQTWQSRRDEQDVAWNDLAFMDEANGWVVGEAGRMLHTKDAGKTWALVQSDVKSSLMGVAFRDAENGVVVGLEGVLLTTKDGGKTWHHQPRARRSVANLPSASADKDATESRARTVEEAGEHLFDVAWDAPHEAWLAVGNQGVWVRSNKDAEQWQAGSIDPRDLAWHTRVVVANGHSYLAGARAGMWESGAGGQNLPWHAFVSK